MHNVDIYHRCRFSDINQSGFVLVFYRLENYGARIFTDIFKIRI